MALTTGGLLLLPACGTLHFLSSRQEQLLTHIVDTIIPATDTLGAKDLNVPTFVQKVLTDCYEQEVQEAFLRGLDTVERISKQDHGKSFSALKPPQRLELLTQMGQADEEEQQAFLKLVNIAPWYSHVEKFAGISGNRDGLPQLPDGEFLPPTELNCVETHLQGPWPNTTRTAT